MIKAAVIAMVVILGVAGCEAQGGSPEHPIYARCDHG